MILTFPISVIDAWIAPGAFQDSKVDWLLCIVVWLMLISGGILGITVMVTVDDAVLPDLPFASKVYVVVEAGVIDVEPETATAPTSGDTVTPLVFVVAQVRVVVSPTSMEDLLALNELITGA